jgi:hypothetical protein
MSSVQTARMNRTVLFFTDREWFMQQLVRDIESLVRKAARKGLTPLVRLNGTSDIRWESVRMADGRTIFECFPDVQFYDYTKLSNRKDIPANYDLTFSWSGVATFDKYAQQARANGMRIAVVFRTKDSIPATFQGMECIGGDDSDVRHLEPQGVVVALYAKGPAKKDTTGFVVDTPRIIPILQAA